MSTPIQNAEAEIAYHLEEIAKCFKQPKITLIVRTLDVPVNGDLVLTDDDPKLAIKALQTLLKKGDKNFRKNGTIPSPIQP